MQVVSNAPNSELQQGAPPCSRLVHAPLLEIPLHKAAALSRAVSLATGVLWLGWSHPTLHSANCPRKYRLHRNSPTHPLAAGRRRWNSPQTPTNPSKPGTKKRDIIRIHFRPLFLRRTASSTTGICLDTASSLNPYHSPSTPSTANRRQQHLSVLDRPLFFWPSWTCAIIREHPQPRRIHRAQPPESSTPQLYDTATPALTQPHRADRPTASPRPRTPSLLEPEHTTPHKDLGEWTTRVHPARRMVTAAPHHSSPSPTTNSATPSSPRCVAPISRTTPTSLTRATARCTTRSISSTRSPCSPRLSSARRPTPPSNAP